MVYISAKAEAFFNIKFKTKEETIPDTFASLRERFGAPQ